jgi:hypothetical protein
VIFYVILFQRTIHKSIIESLNDNIKFKLID